MLDEEGNAIPSLDLSRGWKARAEAAEAELASVREERDDALRACDGWRLICAERTAALEDAEARVEQLEGRGGET